MVVVLLEGSIDKSSEDFLARSRELMPVPHSQFISYMASRPSIRSVLTHAREMLSGEIEGATADIHSSLSKQLHTLVESHNATVKAVADFRSRHVKVSELPLARVGQGQSLSLQY